MNEYGNTTPTPSWRGCLTALACVLLAGAIGIGQPVHAKTTAKESNSAVQQNKPQEYAQLFEQIYNLYFVERKLDEADALLRSLPQETLLEMSRMLEKDKRAQNFKEMNMAYYRHYQYLETLLADLAGTSEYYAVYTGTLAKFVQESSGPSWACYMFNSDQKGPMEICMKAGRFLGKWPDEGDRLKVYMCRDFEFPNLAGKAEKLAPAENPVNP